MVGGGAAPDNQFLDRTLGDKTRRKQRELNTNEYPANSLHPKCARQDDIQIEIERATCDDIRNNNFENDNHLYVIKIVVI